MIIFWVASVTQMGRSFPNIRQTFQVRKVIGGGGWQVASRIIMSVPVPFLWDLGLGLGLDNIKIFEYLIIIFHKRYTAEMAHNSGIYLTLSLT